MEKEQTHRTAGTRLLPEFVRTVDPNTVRTPTTTTALGRAQSSKTH